MVYIIIISFIINLIYIFKNLGYNNFISKVFSAAVMTILVFPAIFYGIEMVMMLIIRIIYRDEIRKRSIQQRKSK